MMMYITGIASMIVPKRAYKSSTTTTVIHENEMFKIFLPAAEWARANIKRWMSTTENQSNGVPLLNGTITLKLPALVLMSLSYWAMLHFPNPIDRRTNEPQASNIITYKDCGFEFMIGTKLNRRTNEPQVN